MTFRGESPSMRRRTELMDRTGSVILGGFIRAAKMASDASGRDPREHKVVFLGGGSAAVG
jgi:malate dehydrogenase (oxaloacetate-decarboxylating)(NADP+)